MEPGLIVQFLMLAGIIGYGAWSAVRKGEKAEEQGGSGGGVSPHRKPWGENFPFPSPELPSSSPSPSSPSSQMAGRWGNVEEGGASLEKWNQIKVREEMTDHLAVSTLQMDEEAETAVEEMMGEEKKQQGGANVGGVSTDLRTMIISSELLKPKFQEY